MTTSPVEPDDQVRASRRWWPLITVIAILGALLGSASVRLFVGKGSTERTARELADLNADLADRTERGLDGANLSLRAEVDDLDARIRLLEEIIASSQGVDADIGRALLATLQRHRAAFATFVDAWTPFLNQGGLAAPTRTRDEIETLRARCQRMAETTRELDRMEQGLPDLFEEEMTTRAVPASRRADALRDYRRGISLELRAAMRATDIAMAEDARLIYDFLLQHWGHWTTNEYGTWVFEEGIDYTPVNDAIARIEAAATTQQEIQRQLIDHMRQAAESSR